MNNRIYAIIILSLLIGLAECQESKPVDSTIMVKTTVIPSKTVVPDLPSPTMETGGKLNGTTLKITSTGELTSTQTVKTMTPTETELPIEPDTPGWILFTNYDSFYRESLDIVHTSGIGWKKIYSGDYPNFPQAPFWRPDGQWVGFVGDPSNEDGDDIYIIRPDGSEINRLTYIEGYKRANSWSPNGKWIIYSQTVGEPKQAEVDLYEIEVETKIVRQITHTEGIYEHSPIYSPGGDEIVYSSVKEGPGQEFHLYIMNRDGSDVRQVSEMPIFSGVISPNGKKIAFSSSDKCEDIYTIELANNKIIRLTDLPGSETHPSWSPDGRWLAFMGMDTCGNPGLTGWEIYIVREDGKGLKRLTHIDEENPLYPAWAPLPAIQSNKNYIITESGSDLKLRQGPSLQAEVLDRLKEGEVIDVIEGPIEADQYLWWRVIVEEDGQEGWIAENPGWFAPGD